jgi:hypothetical protein
MKYYHFKTCFQAPKNGKLLANNSVTGNEMPIEYRQIVGRLSNGEFINTDIVLKPFTMIGFGAINTWERFLFDVHDFLGNGSGINGFYVSEKFKNLVEPFQLDFQSRFYETVLLYKKQEYKYFIFQIKSLFEDIFDYDKSEFGIYENVTEIFHNKYENSISSYEKYREIDNNLYETEKKHLAPLKIKLNFNIHFFRFPSLGYFISDELKNILEENQIKGVEFIPSKIEFEVL